MRLYGPPGSSRRCRAASKEDVGGKGKPRDPPDASKTRPSLKEQNFLLSSSSSSSSSSSLASPARQKAHTQQTTRVDRKMPQPESRHPVFFQSSQATVLELWASPEVLGPPGTLLDTSCSHQETPKAHRKRPHLTGKCLTSRKSRPGCF